MTRKSEPVRVVAQPVDPAPATDDIAVDGDVEGAGADERERRPDRPPRRDLATRKDRDEAKDPPREVAPKESRELREMRLAEDATLREIVESLGPSGSYTIRVTRKDPEELKDPTTGRMIKVGGFLRQYDDPIDEERIQRVHGGGTFQIVFRRRTPQGQLVYCAARTVVVAGEPNLDDPALNRTVPPAPQAPAATAANGESPGLVARAFDVLQGEMRHARERRSDDMSPATERLLEQLTKQNEAAMREIGELRRALASSQTRPDDPFRDRMLDSLMKEDSARIAALRTQYESEIRVVRDNAVAELRRAEERADRMMDGLRASHDREVASMRSAHETTSTAIRAANETQLAILNSEVNSLRQALSETRAELISLRERKDRSIIEQAKEFSAIKEAIGGVTGGDDEGKASAVDRVLEVIANPATMEFAKGIFGQRAAPTPAPPPTPSAAPQRPRIVRASDGSTHVMGPNGLIPIKRKKKVIQTTNADGTPGPELPAIAPEMAGAVIQFLEHSFAANQDPVLVAQTYRAHVPEEIMNIIREHGVDVFLSKVAKLPSGSPLSNQAGKNWVRKVGEALVE